MLLVIMHERHARFIILLALLVAELADMASRLAGLAPISRFHHLGARAKRAESALARHERRFMSIGEQPSHDLTTRVGVLLAG